MADFETALDNVITESALQQDLGDVCLTNKRVRKNQYALTVTATVATIVAACGMYLFLPQSPKTSVPKAVQSHEFQEPVIAGDGFYQKADWERALSCYRLAENMAVSRKNDRWIRKSRAKIAAVLLKQKKYADAIELCKPILSSRMLVADSTDEIETRTIAVQTICQCYADLKEYKLMLPWAEHASTFHHRLCTVDHSLSTLVGAVRADIVLGSTYEAVGNHQQAVAVLGQALEAWPLSKSEKEYVAALTVLKRAQESQLPTTR